jgi:hypothetical protein
MLSIEHCRALLSTEIVLSDTEIEELRGLLYNTASLAFEAYWSDSNSGSKNPLGLLHDSNPVDIV